MPTYRFTYLLALEPSKSLEGRTRFNSLDSGILFNSPASQPKKQGTASSINSRCHMGYGSRCHKLMR